MFLSEVLSGLAAALPFGIAFGAGMVAAVNPCGFAMLPAYLSLYLGAEESGFSERSTANRLLRALVVGSLVSSGFIVLFGAAGFIISSGGTVLVGAMPVLGVLVGETLVVLGLWMLFGRSMNLGSFGRWAARLGDPGNVGARGFFVYGLAYGAASLGCTLPTFLAVVGSGFVTGGMAQGAWRFVIYALGMASVVVVLTLALALFKGNLLTRVRKAVPYVQSASAVLLVLAGAYVLYYWW